MYKQNCYTVLSNSALTDDVYRMVLSGDTQYITAPGQFVNLALDGKFLRRPISVCDCDSDTLTLVYKIVGSGTAQMSQAKSGDSFDILTGLGNGYSIPEDIKKPLLIGGGVGVPPLYYLAKALIKKGIVPAVILGFNTEKEIFFEKEFSALGCDVFVTTVDGSYGTKGFVTAAMDSLNFDYFFTCGPMPMLRAVYDSTDVSGQFSFEERMGCGFGACMGCSCKTKNGSKRICTDGPVLKKEEIIFD